MRFRPRTLLLVLAVGPALLAIIYFNPRLTVAFLTLLASAAFADWLARRLSGQPRSKPPDR
jgi:cobalamin synthase